VNVSLHTEAYLLAISNTGVVVLDLEVHSSAISKDCNVGFVGVKGLGIPCDCLLILPNVTMINLVMNGNRVAKISCELSRKILLESRIYHQDISFRERERR
jgi:hypothetical protein